MKTNPSKCSAFPYAIFFLSLFISTVSNAQFKRIDQHVYFASNKRAVSETVMLNDDNSSSYFIAYSATEPYKAGVQSFSGELTGNSVLLKWKLMNPSYMKEVIVERSIKGSKFEPIGKIKVQGKTNVENNTFQYTDNGNRGENVSYRLKLTCRHNVKQYSNVLKVGAGGRKILSFPVFSDATSNKIIINIDSDINEKTKMMVVDNNGMIVKQKDVSLSTGVNNFSVDNLENLSPGNYHAIIKKKGDIYTSSFLIH